MITKLHIDALVASKTELHKASPDECDQIYMMGFDTWADGSTKLDYLNLCRNAPKYKRGQWYVLKERDLLLSSLIVYRLEEDVYGIGSISTPNLLRKKGYASRLISEVIELLEKDFHASAIFLYSDIKSEFYEKFGFEKIPKNYQRYNTTICLIRTNDMMEYLSLNSRTPEYF